MGGTLTLELICKEFTEMISNRLNKLSSLVGNMQVTPGAGNIVVTGQGQNNNKRKIQVGDDM